MSFAKFLVTSAALLSSSMVFATGLEDLNLFKSGQLTKGLWRMELLNSNDPTLQQGGAAMGKVGICADIAKQISKGSELDEKQCTPKILRDSKDGAEFEVTCQDGMHSHVKLNRESDKSYLLDSQTTTKDGKTRNLTARYTYEGACKGDSVIQMDKNSTACKQMSNVDTSKMAAMCANAPEQYRAQCEQQMKQMSGMCQ